MRKLSALTVIAGLTLSVGGGVGVANAYDDVISIVTIPFPSEPAVENPAGPNNSFYVLPEDTLQIDWERLGERGVIATPKPGYIFEKGHTALRFEAPDDLDPEQDAKKNVNPSWKFAPNTLIYDFKIRSLPLEEDGVRYTFEDQEGKNYGLLIAHAKDGYKVLHGDTPRDVTHVELYTDVSAVPDDLDRYLKLAGLQDPEGPGNARYTRLPENVVMGQTADAVGVWSLKDNGTLVLTYPVRGTCDVHSDAEGVAKLVCEKNTREFVPVDKHDPAPGVGDNNAGGAGDNNGQGDNGGTQPAPGDNVTDPAPGNVNDDNIIPPKKDNEIDPKTQSGNANATPPKKDDAPQSDGVVKPGDGKDSAVKPDSSDKGKGSAGDNTPQSDTAKKDVKGSTENTADKAQSAKDVKAQEKKAEKKSGLAKTGFAGSVISLVAGLGATGFGLSRLRRR